MNQNNRGKLGANCHLEFKRSAELSCIAAYNACRADMQSEIDELQGYCSEAQDKMIMADAAIGNLKSELAKRDTVIEKMRSALEDISKYTDGPRSSPDGEFIQGKASEEAQIADETLADISKILDGAE